jgi:hypothetical protein
MVRIKLTYLISIFCLLISCNQKQRQIDTLDSRIIKVKTKPDLNSETESTTFDNQNIVADTITNWQFYKDSELLFKSHLFDLNRYTAKIKTTDKYEYLSLNMSYDFNNDIMKRRIELVLEKKVLRTFVDENRSQSPFRIPKSAIDKVISDNIGKEILINYFDPINKDGLTIGVLQIINE